MRIVFQVNDVAFMDYKNLTAIWGWEPTDTRLGGTEESIHQWAKQLKQRGHDVEVHRNSRSKDTETAIYDNVKYQARLHQCDRDVTINVKSSDIKPQGPTLYLTNETDVTEADLSMYDGIIWPSSWALENIPVNNKTLFVLPHGYDEKQINSQHKKINKQCLYASSPDRGLDTLEQIWPTIVDEHPDAHLYVSYGAKIGTPNTTCGEFSEEEMNHLYNTSDLWLHPCSGGELFGISGIKAQAAGAIPVYFPTMALAETVQVGVSCTDPRDMYEKLTALLDNQAEKDRLRSELAKIHFTNWSDSTDRLLEIIHEVVQ